MVSVKYTDIELNLSVKHDDVAQELDIRWKINTNRKIFRSMKLQQHP